jgi:GTP-binding protein Era
MYKAGFIGLIGQPNAGKSTLLNNLVKERVSIVSSKPQTTRRRVIGLTNKEQGQLIFVDAPGVLNAQKGLNAFLTQEALDVIEQSDVIIAVLGIDTENKEDIEKIVELCVSSKKAWMAVITKVDIERFQARILKIEDILAKHKSCRGIFKVSDEDCRARKQDFEIIREQIFEKCLELLPESPKPLYDVELYTPHSVKELTAEIIREKCFEVLHHEIPYNIAVRMQKFDESGDLPKIYCEILVAKESQKPIVIGKKGETIKEIGILARKEVEKMMGQKVFLSLEVSVRQDWFENKNIMRDLGYFSDNKK